MNGCHVRIVGTIPGFVPDGQRVTDAIAEHQPDAIALGVPDTDLESMEALIADPTLADGLEPDELDLHFLEQIAQWGATQFIPSPDLHAAHEAELPLHGIDLSDEEHTQRFTDSVKVRHLVRRSAVRKRLGKTSAEDAVDPYDLARQWDEQLCTVAPLSDLEQAREDHMAASVRSLATEHKTLLVVLHAARFEGVFTRLTNGP